VGRFGVVSLVPVVLIGLVLAHFISDQVHKRALAEARKSAVLVARVGIQPLLTPSQIEHGLDTRQLAALNRALRAGATEADVARIKIWNRKHEVVYSDDRKLIGRKLPPSDELEEAFAGEIKTEVSDTEHKENVYERQFGRLLETYVPLRFHPKTPPKGVFEIYLPYAPIAASIKHDTKTLVLLLLGGLVLLYAAIFRIVVGASRRLRRQAEENAHLALHDTLTDLPNRTLFRDRVQQAILRAAREGDGVAVMLMDLDRFKEVNDTLGHHSGDVVLRQLSRRLSEALRESDSIARLGGDEFALLLPKVAGAPAAIQAAERVTDVLDQPFVLQDLPIALEGSIGIALYPEHATDVDTLVQRADVAMYAAKGTQRPYALYDPADDEYSPGRLGLVGELRRAIDERELVLHYQPKANLATGEITGAEALIRWQHPERGLLSPAEFVPLAEHTNLIKPLTHYVLEEALTQCRAWHHQGLKLPVSVNIASRNLLDSELPNELAELLEGRGVGPELLELEITESTIMADPLRALDVLSRLHELGIRLAIDDFGTGYSSLAYLSGLPVDEVKIDRGFVMDMGENQKNATIVRSTIDLGRNLGLIVVAEGVETESTWETLRTIGCDAAQGYFLSRPVPASELGGWLAKTGMRVRATGAAAAR
jgi:diguanylate cyclase (GGDEF)-like protein